jgi:hypothetical protein
MEPATGPKSVVRATLGVVAIIASLVVIPIGFVLLVVDSRPGGGASDLVRPLATLMAGGGLLSTGIALLIWEMSVRYGIRR